MTAAAAASHARPRPMVASGYALMTAGTASLVPLVVHLFAADADPFWFGTTLMAANAATWVAALAMSDQPTLPTLHAVLVALWSFTKNGPRGWVTLFAMTAGTSCYGLFAAASHHAGPVTATVLFQLWTLSAAGLLAVRYGPLTRRLDGRSAALMAAAVASTALAVATQAPTVTNDGTWWVGVVLGVAAGAMAGTIFSESVVVACRAAPPDACEDTKIAAMVAAVVIATASAVPIGAVMAALTDIGNAGGGMSPSAVVASATAGVLIASGGLAARFAHLRSAGLGITAIMGLDPVMALLWLAAAGAGFVNPLQFAVGVAALAAINTAIQTRDAAAAQSQFGHPQDQPRPPRCER